MNGSVLNSTLVSSELPNLSLTYLGSILLLNVIIIGSIFLNISVILITYIGKCMQQNPNSIYVLSLAIADLLKGIFFFMNGIILEHYTFKNRRSRVPFIVCVIPRSLVHMASLFSGYTLLLTSFVQYFAVAHPYFHKRWMKGLFSRLAIAIGWVLCIVQTVCVFISLVQPAAGQDIECNDYVMFGNELHVKQILEVLDFWISLCILTLLNGMLIKEIIRIGNQVSQTPNEGNVTTSKDGNITPCFTAVMELQQCPGSFRGSTGSSVVADQLELSGLEQHGTNSGQSPKLRSKHWKPFITLIVLVAAFAISLGPYSLYFTVKIFSTHQIDDTSNAHKSTVRILSFGVLVNTLINPLIYAFRIPVYRQFIERNVLKTRL